jgi:hypothetical protein
MMMDIIDRRADPPKPWESPTSVEDLTVEEAGDGILWSVFPKRPSPRIANAGDVARIRIRTIIHPMPERRRTG